LLRKLIDEERLKWDAAWPVVTKTFAYTNHTVLPEALEVWPVHLMQHVLPRHMQLIYHVNHRFLKMIDAVPGWTGDVDRQRRMSIIEEGFEKKVRMAHLAIVGSHAVNGVAAMHTEIVKHHVFADFYELWPEKFKNVTNGVTPRRWIEQANPGLSELLTRWLHTDEWTTNLTLLANLKDRADDPQFQHEWRLIKAANKTRLTAFIKKVLRVEVNPTSLFDVHIKRIHEYKRQLLNLLHVIHRYLSIKKGSDAEKSQKVPRVVIFAGKAAPGYIMAKRHIKLINSVADVINNDKAVGDLLKVVFIPNYSVSMAEVIIPGSDINQQISTAGTEASGTSNMKFALNGSLVIGTLDGANVEISEEVGEDNMFIFGLRSHQIESTRALLRESRQHTASADKVEEKPAAETIKMDPRLQEVFRAIQGGVFGPAEVFQPILDTLLLNDYYLLTVDFPLYIEAQEKVDATWKDQKLWTRKSILNTAGTAKFSSDRSILEYAENIWDLKPCPVTQSQHRLY
jgi:starch phosphorylase